MLDALIETPRRTLPAPAIATAIALHALVIAAALLRPAPQVEDLVLPQGPVHVRVDRRPQARPGDAVAHVPPQKKFSSTRPRPSMKPPSAAPAPTRVAAPAKPVKGDLPDDSTEPSDPADGAPCERDCGSAAGSAGGGGGVDEVLLETPDLVRPRAACTPERPPMPEQARLMGISGAIVVRYAVQADGNVSDLRVMTPNAAPILLESVRNWLLRCAFHPATLRGRPVQVHVIQPFVFRIQ